MTVIPAFPETALVGIKKQLTTRILECEKGGYIIIFEGHGLAAKSTWDEVLDCVEDIGGALMKAERMPLPRVFKDVPMQTPSADDIKKTVQTGLNNIGMVLAAAASAILAFISVKIT